MNIYIKLFYISAFLIYSQSIRTQTYLTNPSLEDKPADATMPSGWFPASEGTTPDILPGYWGVYTEAEDGESYVGLITRGDGSYESIYQRLETSLEKGVCYSMSCYLAHSDNYTGYNHPLKLRVWIANKKNKRQQLIYESKTISSEEWQFQKIDFIPQKDMHFFIIEAYNEDNRTHEGNILIDAFSQPIICNKA